MTFNRGPSFPQTLGCLVAGSCFAQACSNAYEYDAALSQVRDRLHLVVAEKGEMIVVGFEAVWPYFDNDHCPLLTLHVTANDKVMATLSPGGRQVTSGNFSETGGASCEYPSYGYTPERELRRLEIVASDSSGEIHVRMAIDDDRPNVELLEPASRVFARGTSVKLAVSPPIDRDPHRQVYVSPDSDEAARQVVLHGLSASGGIVGADMDPDKGYRAIEFTIPEEWPLGPGMAIKVDRWVPPKISVCKGIAACVDQTDNSFADYYERTHASIDVEITESSDAGL